MKCANCKRDALIGSRCAYHYIMRNDSIDDRLGTALHFQSESMLEAMLSARALALRNDPKAEVPDVESLIKDIYHEHHERVRRIVRRADKALRGANNEDRSGGKEDRK